VFSLLDPDDRRALLGEAKLVELADQHLIIKEGAVHDSLFFIKRGEVEVFRTDQDGMPIFINKLQHGQFFGEIAAVRGTKRSVSVRAMGDVSLFEIARGALTKILDREPRLRQLFEATIASRTQETSERVAEHQRIFFGT